MLGIKKTLPIRTIGDPALGLKAKKVQKIDDDLRALAEKMVNTMYKADGVGLAAPQVGIGIRMFVMHVYHPEDEEGRPMPYTSPGERELLPEMPVTFVNPEIIAYGKELEDYDEGCLSLPKLYATVKRPSSIAVRATLLDGRTVELECAGMLARVIQHEYDHLDGIVFAQRLDDENYESIRDGITLLVKKNGKRGFKLRRLNNDAGNTPPEKK